MIPNWSLGSLVLGFTTAQPNLRVTISLILCPMNRATTVNPWTPALFRREQRSLFRVNVVYFTTIFYLSI